MNASFKAVLAGVLLASFHAASWGAENLRGKVTGIVDGDTLTVQTERQSLRVRLAEIDAPAMKQSFGDKARDSLAEICLQKDAEVEPMSREAGGALVARVKCEGVNASSAQVERGMAWVRDQKQKSATPLYLLQDEAQRSRAGLWSEASPVAPWRWRGR